MRASSRAWVGRRSTGRRPRPDRSPAAPDLGVTRSVRRAADPRRSAANDGRTKTRVAACELLQDHLRAREHRLGAHAGHPPAPWIEVERAAGRQELVPVRTAELDHRAVLADVDDRVMYAAERTLELVHESPPRFPAVRPRATRRARATARRVSCRPRPCSASTGTRAARRPRARIARRSASGTAPRPPRGSARSSRRDAPTPSAAQPSRRAPSTVVEDRVRDRARHRAIRRARRGPCAPRRSRPRSTSASAMLVPALRCAYDEVTQPSMCAGGAGISAASTTCVPSGSTNARVLGEQTDEVLAVLAHDVAAHQRTLADEVALARVHDPAHPEVVGRLRAVGLLARRSRSPSRRAARASPRCRRA